MAEIIHGKGVIWGLPSNPEITGEVVEMSLGPAVIQAGGEHVFREQTVQERVQEYDTMTARGFKYDMLKDQYIWRKE